MKNVIVIGGSMFTGRVFSIMASRNEGYDLYVVNRGNHPMNLDRVHQYTSDRHDVERVASLIPDKNFDTLIDFCAYNPGEIEQIIKSLGKRIKQYIFFSTASIYHPADGFLDENAQIIDITENSTDFVNDYIRNKVILENELIVACEKAGIGYTILRPAFIYGPFNYAPREPYFIELIAKRTPVPVPIDSTSRYNFIYVMDIADILMNLIGDARGYNKVYNLAGDEAITYESLISEFRRLHKEPILTRDVTVSQVETENIPLPFPLTGDTLYDGSMYRLAFDHRFTPFSVGMEKTFQIFHTLYTT